MNSMPVEKLNKSHAYWRTEWMNSYEWIEWILNTAFGTVSRKNAAVLLDFVQTTSNPPLPNLDILYNLFERQKRRLKPHSKWLIVQKSLKFKLFAFWKK